MQKKISAHLKGGRLQLKNDDLDDKDLEIICSKNRQNIREINFSSNRITTKGMEYFMNAQWSHLTSLNLSNNEISAKGCKYLSSIFLPAMQYLNLSNNRMGGVGIFHLSKSNFEMLQKLQIDENYLYLDYVRKMIRANWPKLAIIIANQNLMERRQLMAFILAQLKLIKLQRTNFFHTYRERRFNEELDKKTKEEIIKIMKMKFKKIKIYL